MRPALLRLTAPRGPLPGPEALCGALPWLPLGLAALYVVALLRTLGAVVGSIYSSADVVSAPYIGELYARAPHGAEVVLGNIPWYSALWFETATRAFPAHRVIWEVAPWILTLIGAALAAWATVKAADRWAGMIVAVCIGCSGAALLPLQFAWSIHAMAYVHVCVLAAYDVALTGDAAWIGGGPRAHLAIAALVASITGVGIASDNLVILAGLVPFALAGLAGAWLRPSGQRRVSTLSVLGVTMFAVALGVLLGHLMRSDHVVPSPFPVAFAPYNRLLDHVGLLLQSLVVLMNGDFGGSGFGTSSGLAFACAAAILAGAIYTIRVGRSSAGALLRRVREGAFGIAPTADTRLLALLAFWLSSGLLLSVAFVFTTVAVDIENKRYLVTVAYSIICVSAVTARRPPARALVTLGACAIVAASTLSIFHRDIEAGNAVFPSTARASTILRWARSQHLDFGYAGYLDAAALTWETRTRVAIYPVSSCAGTQRICPFGLHRISSWYRPRPGRRSFFLVDPAFAAPNGISAPPASLRTPLRTSQIAGLTAYVYPYDIAARFGPPPP